jgi:hypothetical protein
MSGNKNMKNEQQSTEMSGKIIKWAVKKYTCLNGMYNIQEVNIREPNKFYISY